MAQTPLVAAASKGRETSAADALEHILVDTIAIPLVVAFGLEYHVVSVGVGVV